MAEKATITVKYINEPKGNPKKGSVKDDAGKLWGVWKDKLESFKVGATYDIEYSTFRTNSGVSLHTIEKFTEVAGAQPRAAAGGGGAWSGVQDEHIFVSMMLKESVRAQLLDPNNEDAVVELALRMRGAHKQIWSAPPAPAPQPRRDVNPDMDDSIPF